LFSKRCLSVILNSAFVLEAHYIIAALPDQYGSEMKFVERRLKPTVQRGNRTKRGQEGVSSVATRRHLISVSFRGLKPTATFIPSLCD
jgi:hypothetical protein